MISWRELRSQSVNASALLLSLPVGVPLTDLDAVAHALDVRVSLVDALDDGVSGLLRFDAGEATVQLSSQEPAHRRRFILATFLGHLMRSPPGVYLQNSSGRPTSGLDWLAAQFGAELLMPTALAAAQLQLPFGNHALAR
jgi:hypothetical protein